MASKNDCLCPLTLCVGSPPSPLPPESLARHVNHHHTRHHVPFLFSFELPPGPQGFLCRASSSSPSSSSLPQPTASCFLSASFGCSAGSASSHFVRPSCLLSSETNFVIFVSLSSAIVRTLLGSLRLPLLVLLISRAVRSARVNSKSTITVPKGHSNWRAGRLLETKIQTPQSKKAIKAEETRSKGDLPRGKNKRENNEVESTLLRLVFCWYLITQLLLVTRGLGFSSVSSPAASGGGSSRYWLCVALRCTSFFTPQLFSPIALFHLHPFLFAPIATISSSNFLDLLVEPHCASMRPQNVVSTTAALLFLQSRQLRSRPPSLLPVTPVQRLIPLEFALLGMVATQLLVPGAL